MTEIKLRLGGTNEYAASIDPDAAHCAPPGEVLFVEGWDNPAALVFETMENARKAKRDVWDIEGFHTTIECRKCF